MKLERSLSGLVDRCQTICVAECCGRAAYDFSPIQIASYITMLAGSIVEAEVIRIRAELETLKVNYGLKGASSKGVTLDDMNQKFSANGIEDMVKEIEWNLSVAIDLVSESEKKRYKHEN